MKCLLSSTDLPLYRVWQSGKLIEKTDSLMKYSWENKVSFYIGCSFGFEKPLQDEGVPVRNVEQQCNVSMFRTNIPCHSVEPFHNNLVVAMRPIPQDLLKACVETTQRLTGIHGGPIHIGNPEIIGIKDLSNPDYGDVLQFHDGDIPVFWGCGVTAIEAIIAAGDDYLKSVSTCVYMSWLVDLQRWIWHLLTHLDVCLCVMFHMTMVDKIHLLPL